MAVETAIAGAVAKGVGAPRLGILAPLGVRSFGLFWVAAILIWANENVRHIAISSVALDLTQRPSGLANVLTLNAVPVTLLMLVGGLAADRFRPHVVVMGAVFVSASAVGVLAALTALGNLAYWHLLVYAVVTGTAGGFFNGAYFAVLPSLLPADRVRSANGLTQVTENRARFVVPPLAGLLVAAASAPPALAIASTLGVGAALLLSAIREVAPDSAPAATARTSTASPLAQLVEGFRAARQDAAVWVLIWTGTIAVFGSTAAMAVGFPALAKLAMNAGDEGIGVLYGALGAGALAGAFLTGALRSVRRPGLVLGLAGVMEGGLLVVAAFAPTLWTAVPLVVLAGLVEAVRIVLALTILQTRPPAAVRGRVMAIAALAAFGLNPVAHALAGAVGDGLGPRAVVALGGMVLAVGCGLAASSKAVRSATLA